MTNALFAHRLGGSFGELFAVQDAAGALVRLDFVGSKERAADEEELGRRFARSGEQLRWEPARFAQLQDELAAYDDGTLRTFRIALAPRGTTFQLRVWKALRGIPFAATESYGALAQRIGRQGAARAVGRANGTNPISLIVPCHRVVGSNGRLTGYAGGLERKRALLEHEREAAASMPVQGHPTRFRGRVAR